MNYLPHAAIAGWIAAIATGWLWLQARDDVAEAKELCNREKIEAVAEAREKAREASERAATARETALLRRIEVTENARQVALQAARAAESRPERVRKVIERVADADSCLDMPVSVDILDSLHD